MEDKEAQTVELDFDQVTKTHSQEFNTPPQIKLTIADHFNGKLSEESNAS